MFPLPGTLLWAPVPFPLQFPPVPAWMFPRAPVLCPWQFPPVPPWNPPVPPWMRPLVPLHVIHPHPWMHAQGDGGGGGGDARGGDSGGDGQGDGGGGGGNAGGADGGGDGQGDGDSGGGDSSGGEWDGHMDATHMYPCYVYMAILQLAYISGLPKGALMQRVESACNYIKHYSNAATALIWPLRPAQGADLALQLLEEVGLENLSSYPFPVNIAHLCARYYYYDNPLQFPDMVINTMRTDRFEIGLPPIPDDIVADIHHITRSMIARSGEGVGDGQGGGGGGGADPREERGADPREEVEAAPWPRPKPMGICALPVCTQPINGMSQFCSPEHAGEMRLHEAAARVHEAPPPPSPPSCPDTRVVRLLVFCG